MLTSSYDRKQKGKNVLSLVAREILTKQMRRLLLLLGEFICTSFVLVLVLINESKHTEG